MKKYLVLLSLMFLGTLAFSQNYKEKIESHKVAFITKQLDLSPEESQAFWPIYNQFSEAQREVREENKPPKRPDFNSMTEEEANNLIRQHISVEERLLEIKKARVMALRDVIPAVKIVKLEHAERVFKKKLLEKVKERRKGRK